MVPKKLLFNILTEKSYKNRRLYINMIFGFLQSPIGTLKNFNIVTHNISNNFQTLLFHSTKAGIFKLKFLSFNFLLWCVDSKFGVYLVFDNILCIFWLVVMKKKINTKNFNLKTTVTNIKKRYCVKILSSPIKSIITIGSSPYLRFFPSLYSWSSSKNAATYGVNMAVYITNINIIQSQTALNGE
jgi:hypothetical protein